MASVGLNSCAYHIGQGGTVLQPPFDAAVITPTILRPELTRAIRSVFAQKDVRRIQILVGIDQSDSPRTVLEDVGREIPDNCVLSIFDLGYSTSARHGGVHEAYDGGSLRTALSFLANSRYIAYLDDDNWWGKDHLATMLQAIEGKDWAYSLRWYVDPATGQPITIDRWESIGPGRGAYNGKLGGWADPNTLMIDKLRCPDVLPCWSAPVPNEPTKMSADRRVFDALRSRYVWGETMRPSCFYTIDPNDPAHEHRQKWIEEDRVERSKA